MARDPWMAKAGLQGHVGGGYFHDIVARYRKQESREAVVRWLIRWYRREIRRVTLHPSQYAGAPEGWVERNQKRTLARHRKKLREWESELRKLR